MSWTNTSVAYPDAQVRGRMRIWKKELLRKRMVFERNYRDCQNTFMPQIEAFVMRDSLVGKQRAFSKLARMLGPVAHLEGVRYDPHPLAVWSILCPRDSVTLNAPVESGLMQDCVTVNYVLMGKMPSTQRKGQWCIGINEGYWTLEIPDHAIGRCIHRTGRLPDAIIREAHCNVLKMHPGLVQTGENRFNPEARFNIKAGPGGFVCTFRVGEEETRDEYMARVRADTWISEEGEHQALLVGHANRGVRLADNWLLPAPLRRMYLNEAEGCVCCDVILNLPDLKFK